MKNINKHGKRLLALLLAVVLVVGQIPVGVDAEDTTVPSAEQNTVANTELKVTLTREPVQEAESDDPETEEDGSSTPAVFYRYTVKVTEKVTEDVTELDPGKYTLTWPEADEDFDATETVVTDLAATVTYNGKVITVKYDEAKADENNSVSATWVASANMLKKELIVGETYTKNDVFSAPEAAFADGYSWVLVPTEYVTDEGVKVDTVENGVKIASYQLQQNDSDVVVHSVDYIVNVVYAPVTDVKFYIGETEITEAETEWYNEEQTLTIKATADSAYEASQLAPVTVSVGEEKLFGDGWEKGGEENLWIETVTLNSTRTITVGEKAVTLKIDTAAPSVSAMAYRYDDSSIYVDFNVDPSESGLQSVVIMDGSTVLATITDRSTGIKLETDSNSVQIQATSVAGKTCDPVPVSVSDKLVAKIDPVSGTVIETVGSNVVLKKGETHTITLSISGASNDPSDKLYLNPANIEVTGASVAAEDWSYKDGKYQAVVTVEEDLSNLSIKATDSSAMRRVASASDFNNYVFDTDAPTIDVSVAQPTKTVDGVAYYDAEEVTYTVEIKDNYLTIGEYTIKYTVDGKVKTISPNEGELPKKPVTFTVSKGQTLTNITVDAVDGAGNAADTYDSGDITVIVDNTKPVITGKVTQGDVSKFYTKDGKFFAYMNPAENNKSEADEAVLAITFTLTEANPDAAALKAAGWTEANGVWTKVVSKAVDKDATGVLVIDNLTASDILDHVPDADIVLSAADTTASGEYVTVLTLKATEGKYNGTIHIDRRMPSTGEADAAPTIELVPVVPEGINKVDNLYSGSFSYTLTVNDTSVNTDSDSGVDYDNVTFTLNDDTIAVVGTVSRVDNVFTIPVEAKSGVESNSLTLTVVVPDKVGNTYTYVQNFGIDTKAPEVTVSYDPGEDKAVNGYYNTARTATVTLYDLNLNTVDSDLEIRVDGSKVDATSKMVSKSVSGTTAVYTIKFEDNGTYDLAVSTTDKAGNSTTGTVEGPNPFTIYKDHSIVSVTMTEANYVQVDGTRYYTAPVTVTAKMEDMAHFKIEDSSYGKLTYTLDNGVDTTVEFDKDTGIASFEVKAEQILTNVVIEVVNDAGTRTDAISNDNEYGAWFSATTDGKVSYDDDKKYIAIDTLNPKLSVVRTSKENEGYIQTKDGKDYFNGEVTYSVEVTDKFLPKQQAAIAESILVKVNNEVVAYELNHDSQSADDDKVSFSFTVTDEAPLTSVEILVKDIVGKSAKITSLTDSVYDLSGVNGNTAVDFTKSFDDTYATVKYTGNNNIVDTVDPVVTAEISAVGDDAATYEIEKFYYDGEYFYAYVTPAEHSSNIFNWSDTTEADNVYVTLKFTLNELNPDTDRMPMASDDSDGWSNTNGVWTYTVETAVMKEKASLIEFAVPVVDMADRIPTDNIILEVSDKDEENSYYPSITLTPVTTMSQGVTYGAYIASIYVDRRTPEISYEGEIELAPSVKPVAVVDDKDLFDCGFSFNLTVGDEDSGVKSVDWSLAGEAIDNNYIAQTTNEGRVSEDGTYVIPVSFVGKEEFETAEVTLTITVTDNVDNVYTYVKTFCVDNKNPKVSVVKENLNGAKYIQTIVFESLLETKEVDYYNNLVQYTITASDLFMKNGALSYTIDGKTQSVVLTESKDQNTGVITYTGVVAVGSNQTLSDITFEYNDHGGHHATRLDTAITDPNNRTDFADKDNKVQLSTNDVVVDIEAPEVSVTVKSDDKNPTVGNNVTYYQSPVAYTVEVTDEFLTDMNVATQVQKLNLTYTKENQDGVTVTLPTEKSGWSVSGNTYSYTFTVDEGEVLTGIELEVYDNAGNPIQVAPADFEIKNNVVTYVGNTVVVDNTNPEIKVEKVVNGKFIQDFDGNDYYNGEVTYNFTITDTFLTNVEDTGSKALINVTYLDGTKMETIDLLADTTVEGLNSAKDEYTASFTVKDGEAVKDIEIIVIDNAGNVSTANNVTIVDADSRTSFKTDNGTIKFNGQPFIVDMVKPTASLKINGNVTKYYTNKDGVLFVQLDPTAQGSSGSLVDPADYQEIELVLTINDKNLTLEDNEHPIVSNNTDASDVWSSSITVNADSSVTYTKTIRVKTDEVGVISMDMDVFDLAANPLVIENITYEPLKNTIVTNDAEHIIFSEDGKFTTSVSADRRRPSSVDDNQAPVIQITPADSSMKTNDGIDLYNGAFSFSLNVTDGEASDKNSGIDYVTWTVEDKGVNPFVIAVDDINDAGQDVHKLENIQIPVALNGAGESNNVILTITAVDNVGNVTTFQKVFAVDNLAPRIQVVYDNNDVRNEKYFKADRNATITITDINLNPEQYAVVNSTGVASGWSYDGTVGTSTYSFTVEGEHKFDMNCTDLAGNFTADEAVEYTGAAVHEFILDKTKPVITVTFNPSTPSGRDNAGVNYYDQEQNVTVSVRDKYFNSNVNGSVTANMGNTNTLSAFYQSGEVHTASTTYVEGNNYSFNVTVTDLAGNVSDTYNSETFSVDLTDPTIVISKGDLTNEELNIIQSDLVLSFTINDEQKNLSGYSVKVTHLNNEFKENEVTGAEYYVINDANDRTTVYVDFTSIAAVKANDGTYNVQITAQDYAGHTVSLTPSLNFSLNRFGSTFMTDDEFTANFLAPSEDGTVYQSSVSNKLVIKEINPNKVWQDDSKKVEGSVITIAVNGQSIILEKDVDYTVTLSEEGSGSNKWYVYTYEIDAANFLDGEELVDGNYTILLYGIDEAGNRNTNESNEYGSVQMDGEGNYSGKISFTLDHKAPVISSYGVESGDSVDAESKQLNISLSDNTPASVKVLVNGVEIPLSESTEGLTNDQLWLVYNAETGEYVLNIPESNEKRTITIVTTDAAGNTSEQVIEGVLITSNWFIRAINNPIIVGSFCAVVVALIVFIILILKKKKNKEEQPA